MKILITGSNGLVGQKIVSNLKKRSDIELLATSLNKNKSTSDFPFQLLDIQNKENINNVFDSFRPNVVIHTAAMTDVATCENDKTQCWNLNVISTKNIVDACNNYKSKLIHFSTDFVFDGTSGPYNENSKPNPVSYYGESKLEAEKIVAKDSVDWAIVRTILVYGICSDMARSNIILWVKKNLENNKPIRVVDDQFRMPTLAEDLAEATVQIALRKAKGIFHLSGKEFLSIYELALKTANFFNLDKKLISTISSEKLNETGKRPPSTGFNLYKAINVLDYSPRTIDESFVVLENQLQKT